MVVKLLSSELQRALLDRSPLATSLQKSVSWTREITSGEINLTTTVNTVDFPNPYGPCKCFDDTPQNSFNKFLIRILNS